MKGTQIKKLAVAAMCVALGVVLPMAFHGFPVPNVGSVLLPMHIPVLLCGLCCGLSYGLSCGILVPLLSNLITGMPPAAVLPAILCELAAYGLISGFLRGRVHLKSRAASLYLQLISAMVLGRLVYGGVNVLVFAPGDGAVPAFLTAAFVTALPGIVIQLALIPSAVLLLEKAGVLERPVVGRSL